MAKRSANKTQQLSSEEFRALITELTELKRHDFNEWWERPWLDSMLRRPLNHEYSDREHSKLLELASYAQICGSYDGCSVANLVRQAYFSRLGLDEYENAEDIQWIIGLYESGATSLLKRELNRLVRICKALKVLDY